MDVGFSFDLTTPYHTIYAKGLQEQVVAAGWLSCDTHPVWHSFHLPVCRPGVTTSKQWIRHTLKKLRECELAESWMNSIEEDKHITGTQRRERKDSQLQVIHCLRAAGQRGKRGGHSHGENIEQAPLLSNTSWASWCKRKVRKPLWTKERYVAVFLLHRGSDVGDWGVSKLWWIWVPYSLNPALRLVAWESLHKGFFPSHSSVQVPL